MTAADIAGALARQLQDAWNAADGAAFGKPFAPDADFVTIRGELHSGPAIAAGHQAIFDTIYRQHGQPAGSRRALDRGRRDRRARPGRPSRPYRAAGGRQHGACDHGPGR